MRSPLLTSVPLPVTAATPIVIANAPRSASTIINPRHNSSISQIPSFASMLSIPLILCATRTRLRTNQQLSACFSTALVQCRSLEPSQRQVFHSMPLNQPPCNTWEPTMFSQRALKGDGELAHTIHHTFCGRLTPAAPQARIWHGLHHLRSCHLPLKLLQSLPASRPT